MWLFLGKLWEARSRLYRGRCLQVNGNYSLECSWQDLWDLQTFAPFESDLKRFWQASSGRKAQPLTRNKQTAGMQRDLGGVLKRRCTRHSALTGRVRIAQMQMLLRARRSEFKNSAKFRQTCPHSCSFIFKIDVFEIVIQNSPFLLLFSGMSAILMKFYGKDQNILEDSQISLDFPANK